MEEKKKTTEVTEVTETKQSGAKEFKFTFDMNCLGFYIGVGVLALLALYCIITNFTGTTRVLRGIMSIIFYPLSICGFVTSIMKEKKFSMDVLLNLVGLYFVFMQF